MDSKPDCIPGPFYAISVASTHLCKYCNLASFGEFLASFISIYAKFARLLQVSGEPSFSRKISARICGEQTSENAYWTQKSWQLEINNLATWFSYMFVELHLKKITKRMSAHQTNYSSKWRLFQTVKVGCKVLASLANKSWTSSKELMNVKCW